MFLEETHDENKEDGYVYLPPSPNQQVYYSLQYLLLKTKEMYFNSRSDALRLILPARNFIIYPGRPL